MHFIFVYFSTFLYYHQLVKIIERIYFLKIPIFTNKFIKNENSSSENSSSLAYIIESFNKCSFLHKWYKKLQNKLSEICCLESLFWKYKLFFVKFTVIYSKNYSTVITVNVKLQTATKWTSDNCANNFSKRIRKLTVLNESPFLPTAAGKSKIYKQSTIWFRLFRNRSRLIY